MKVISKKLIVLGSVMATTVVAVCATTSMAKPISNSSNEYIVVNIKGKDMTFINYEKAAEYILTNNIKLKEKIKVGERKYLDRFNGIIDNDSIFDYVADDKHIKPAYKMMNGKYTDSREKALKTFIGRTHLVAQYYDGENMHEGNAIGLNEAKKIIMSKQKTSVVPWQDVQLNYGETMRINPFNKGDIRALQKRSMKIYNENISNKANGTFKHVKAAYLLPKKGGGEIAIVPKNPRIGLTVSDIIGIDSIKTLLDKWIKTNLLKYEFRAGIKWLDGKDNPYYFKSIGDLPKNDNFILNKRELIFKNMSFEDVKKHLSSINAFLNPDDFWKAFTIREHKWYTKWSIETKNGEIFGRKIDIKNAHPSKYYGSSGFDVSINKKEDDEYGTQYAYETTGSLTPKTITLTNDQIFNGFQEFLKTEFQKSALFKQLSESVKSKIDLKAILGSVKDGNEFAVMVKKSATEYSKKIAKGNKGMLNENNAKKIDSQYFAKSSAPTFNNLKETPIHLTNQKILLVNNTPIDSFTNDNFNDKNKNNFSDIYNKTKVIDIDGKIYYYKDENLDNWSDITNYNSSKNVSQLKNFKNIFTFDVGNESSELDIEQFKNIQIDGSYINKIPLLMYREVLSAQKQSENNWFKSNLSNINISKILVAKEQGAHSLFKRDRKNAFFNNNADIRERIKEVNNGFFDPELTYVIYDDNDEIIDVFKDANSNLRFDDKETIIHNSKAILSKYIRKDTNVFFVKNKKGSWTIKPVSNKTFMVYNIVWKDKLITFNSFENVKKFIEEWVKINAKRIIMRG